MQSLIETATIKSEDEDQCIVDNHHRCESTETTSDMNFKATESDEPKNNKSKRKIYLGTKICEECGVVLSSKNALKNHIASIHEKVKKYFCDHCDYGATIKLKLHSHMKCHLKKDSKKLQACQYCPFTSFNKQSLKIHEISFHAGLRYECSCGKIFTHKNKLRLHSKRIHEGVRHHICHCGKQFFLKREFELHT